MAAFATTAELATFTGDTSLDGPRGTLLLDQASAVIRTYCRQTFDLVPDDVVPLRGTWSGRLVLPERPVVSVASVAIDGADIADGYTRVRDVLYRTSWSGPKAVVTVTYTHGFAADAPAMETLKGVCLSVAARAAANPQSMAQESIGSWSGSFVNGVGGFGLTAAEQAILDRFRHEHAAV